MTTTSPKKLLRLRDVLARFPLKKSTWYKGVAAGIYPKPRKLGRASAWREEDIDRLIDEAPVAEPRGDR